MPVRSTGLSVHQAPVVLIDWFPISLPAPLTLVSACRAPCCGGAPAPLALHSYLYCPEPRRNGASRTRNTRPAFGVRSTDYINQLCFDLVAERRFLMVLCSSNPEASVPTDCSSPEARVPTDCSVAIHRLLRLLRVPLFYHNQCRYASDLYVLPQ